MDQLAVYWLKKYYGWDPSYIEKHWNELVLESQRKEPIERWAVYKNDVYLASYPTEECAEEAVKANPYWRAVLLREVVDE